MSKKSRIRGKIILATTWIVLSLFCTVSGTYAWFLSVRNARIGASTFEVTNFEAEIDSVLLYKFEYPNFTGTELIDWHSPEEGTVDSYGFSMEHNQFGETVDEVWKPVTVMNLYDPVSLLITGDTLDSLNCNAIFAVTVASDDFETAGLGVFANRILDKAKSQESDIYLSSCLDFDYFLPSDIAGVTNKALYYPEFKDPETEDLSANEELYFKISYLSKNLASHAHFYGSDPMPERIAIHDSENVRNITFSEGISTFYVNVNYAPSQLEEYNHNIGWESIRALFDYYLEIQLY